MAFNLQQAVDAAIADAVAAALAQDAIADAVVLQQVRDEAAASIAAALAADAAQDAAPLATKDAEIVELDDENDLLTVENEALHAEVLALQAQLAAAPPPAQVNYPTFTVSDSATKAEASGPAVFTVTMTPASTKPVMVDYATIAGTATAGSDYTATSGSLTFAAGETTKTVSVALLNDTAVEGNETFTLSLTNARIPLTIVDDTGVVTITSEDVTPPPPTGFVWPNANNTGVPTGTVLTAYNGPWTITTAGTVITGKTFNRQLVVRANNVIIRKCLFTVDDFFMIHAEDQLNLLVEDCEFRGPGLNGETTAAALGNGTFLRCNMSGMCMGLNLQMKATVKGCWIHDLAFPSLGQPEGAHYDGLALMGSNIDTLIEDNLIQLPNAGTAAIFVSGQFDPIDRVNINHNRILGGSAWSVHFENHNHGVRDCRLTNNELQYQEYGYYWNQGTRTVISGNIDATNGRPISNTNGSQRA